MRPQGVTLNQMMIAIYRANPEVFMHNINLMKAGYVLRVPTLDDIQAVKVAEANSEVRTQIADWRASRGLASAHKPSGNTEQPSLQLVAPSSAAQTTENQVPGAGKSATGAATGAEVAGNAAQGKSTGAGAASTGSNAPIAVESNSMSAVQAQASQQNKQAAATKTTPLNPEKQSAVKSLPKPKITPVQTTASSGGLLDSLLNPYVIIAIIVIILVLIAGIYIKKRRAADEAFSKPVKIRKAPTADADWEKEEKAGLKDVTNLDSADGSAGGSTAEAAMGTTTSHMTTTNLKLDESDPMAEADFHMAYGLYDQAADVLNKALRQDPSRRDLKMKLLEVYFTAGDRTNFVETARGLRQEMGASPDKDWENIAIMGRQVAPEETLFSGEGVAGTSVDIPLDSGGTGTAVHTDLDPLAGAFEGMRPVTMPTAAAKPAPAEQQVVDFSLPDIEPIAKSKKAAAPAAGDKKTEPATGKKAGEATVTADFGTDSQVEFDKALKELSDFVNTNVPPQEEGTRSGTGSGQSMSLAADAEVPGKQTGTSTGTGEETTGLNEIGTKLDLARAYIDMGDSDGAKNILQEVLEEGDGQQQQEARKLLQTLT
jgi:pilus assembly protein FimV